MRFGAKQRVAEVYLWQLEVLANCGNGLTEPGELDDAIDCGDGGTNGQDIDAMFGQCSEHLAGNPGTLPEVGAENRYGCDIGVGRHGLWLNFWSDRFDRFQAGGQVRAINA